MIGMLHHLNYDETTNSAKEEKDNPKFAIGNNIVKDPK